MVYISENGREVEICAKNTTWWHNHPPFVLVSASISDSVRAVGAEEKMKS